MKIAIISDIHDNITNLNKCLEWCLDEKVDKIICCGDLTNNDTLEVLAGKFVNDIYMVRGNAEIYDEEEVGKYKNIKYLGWYDCFEINGAKIGVCHEPWFIDKIIKKCSPKIIFYGHTHKPWIEEKQGVKIVNPGTLSGIFQKATFAFWDTKSGQLELKILD